MTRIGSGKILTSFGRVQELEDTVSRLEAIIRCQQIELIAVRRINDKLQTENDRLRSLRDADLI